MDTSNNNNENQFETQFTSRVINPGNTTPENDPILQRVISVRTVKFLRPVSPIFFNIRARSIEKITNFLWGLTKSTEVIGVKTIDQVNISEGILFGSVAILHMDKSEIHIDQISKQDARNIKKFFEDVVIFQRRTVVNITGD